MKFLCLCYYNAAQFAALSPERMSSFVESCKPHDEALRGTGRLFAVGSLGLPAAWKTRRTWSKTWTAHSRSHGARPASDAARDRPPEGVRVHSGA